MRKVIDAQMMFGQTDISAIRLNPKSRDDIPQILRGLQYIFIEPEVRKKVFAILEEVRPVRSNGDSVNPDTGRPGMAQWTILVLGALRLALNVDYDRILELADEHLTLRQMLGHSEWDRTQYSLQSLKDNLRLLTPEILDRINQEVVSAGHRIQKKSPDEELHARCDSFVVKTDVHFPTDINLLFDAIRKLIETCAEQTEAQGWTEWRQSEHQIRRFKQSYRKAQKLKNSTSNDEEKKKARIEAIQDAHCAYMKRAEGYMEQARETRAKLAPLALDPFSGVDLATIDLYLNHAVRQIDQIRRRVMEDEVIPPSEKVYSLFQPHTKWIMKGKAGVPFELGLMVCIMEDHLGFVLHHQVMEKQTDDQVAVSMVQETQERFEHVTKVSFDKGFHSPSNQTQLKECLDLLVLPKKGRLSAEERAHETDPEFVRLRHAHSAVESAINALEVHGLDKCPDDGIHGFKRYVALAVVARNIQRLGAVLRQNEAAARRGPYKKAA